MGEPTPTPDPRAVTKWNVAIVLALPWAALCLVGPSWLAGVVGLLLSVVLLTPPRYFRD